MTATTERFAVETVLAAAYHRELHLHTWTTGAQVAINGNALNESHYRQTIALIRAGYIQYERSTDHATGRVWRVVTTEDGNKLHRQWRRLMPYRIENN